MNKQEFITGLRSKLNGLPKQDVEERLSFYIEMIDDRIEEGSTEEDAVKGIGSVDAVAQQILSEIPLSKIVKEKIKPKRSLKAWEITLLTVGSPIWVSLLISAFVVVLSLYISFWAVIISCYAGGLSIVAGAFGGMVAGVFFICIGHGATGTITIGAATVCAGLSILSFYGCKELTKIAIRLMKKTVLAIKKCFIVKGDA